MSDGRFTLGLGAGERLNEHVVGRGWPPADVPHQMLTESIEAIRALFSGDMVTYRGRHITVEAAKPFTMPSTPPPIGVAGGGPHAVELAASFGDAFISTEPDAGMVAEYRNRARDRARTIGQVPLSYDADEGRAREYARRFAFGIHGWNDQVCVVQIGDDKDGFFRFWTDELAAGLEKAAR